MLRQISLKPVKTAYCNVKILVLSSFIIEKDVPQLYKESNLKLPRNLSSVSLSQCLLLEVLFFYVPCLMTM